VGLTNGYLLYLDDTVGFDRRLGDVLELTTGNRLNEVEVIRFVQLVFKILPNCLVYLANSFGFNDPLVYLTQAFDIFRRWRYEVDGWYVHDWITIRVQQSYKLPKELKKQGTRDNGHTYKLIVTPKSRNSFILNNGDMMS
jgi:hypothetical protein